jgi:hypothetical protein
MVKPPWELAELPQANPEILDLGEIHAAFIEPPRDWIESVRRNARDRDYACGGGITTMKYAKTLTRPVEDLEPYADGWRASVSKPATPPNYRMLPDRGSFRDGS